MWESQDVLKEEKMDSNVKKILITGAAGQLGCDVAASLKRAGIDPVCRSRGDLDIADKEALFSVIKETAPAVIINAAAYTKVDLAEKEEKKAFAVNSDGARNLAAASEAAGAILIHISTDFVFDGVKSSPYKESEKTNPIGVYGKSKLAGELAVRECCARHIIIRTSWLYGAHGANFVKTILRLASEREVISVVSDQVGSPTWTRDLAEAIRQITTRLTTRDAQAPAIKTITPSDERWGGEKKPFGVYHYADEGVASWYDLAVAVVEEARALGAELKCRTVLPIATSGYPTPAARPSYSVLNKEKIKDEFSLTIPHWRDSLREMLAELSKEGSL